MKIIISGVTGFIGAEVLRQALVHPQVTSVIALSRKPLTGPDSTNPKIKTILMEDFEQYPDSVLSELKGARGCVWALGLVKPGDLDLYRRINVTFHEKASQAFANSLAPELEKGQKFRFAYISGIAAVRDQEKKLWVGEGFRKIRVNISLSQNWIQY